MVCAKLTYRFKAIPIRVSVAFSAETEPILKFIWKYKGHRISKTILKKSKVEEIKLPDFKTYYTKSQ